MDVSTLNKAIMQIAIKKTIIEANGDNYKPGHYKNGRYFFETPEGVCFIIIPESHQTPLLGFECNGKIMYQTLGNRYADKLELLKALNDS